MDHRTGYLICGHGSRDASAMTEFSRLVRGLAMRLPAHAIEHGSLEYVQPTIRDGLAVLRDKKFTRVIALPAMLTGGGHVKSDMPAIFESHRVRYPDIEITVASDLSGDARLTTAAAERVIAAGEKADRTEGQVPLRDTALLVVGSGTSDATANAEVARAARQLWEMLGVAWAEAAFAGVTTPSVDAALERLSGQQYRRIIVLPFMLIPGLLAGRVKDAVTTYSLRVRDRQFVTAETFAGHTLILDALEDRALRSQQDAARLAHGQSRCRKRRSCGLGRGRASVADCRFRRRELDHRRRRDLGCGGGGWNLRNL
jgi:sirohydrochlorin cobaltochelatase